MQVSLSRCRFEIGVQVVEAETTYGAMPSNIPFPDVPGEAVPIGSAIALSGNRILASCFRTRALAATLRPSKAHDRQGSQTHAPVGNCRASDASACSNSASDLSSLTDPVSDAHDMHMTSRPKISRSRRSQTLRAQASTTVQAVQRSWKASSGSSTALAGGRCLAAIMRHEAPSHITLQGIYDLLEACNVMLAEEVIGHVPEYVAPALKDAPLEEVRPAVLVSHSFSHRPQNLEHGLRADSD